MSGRRSAARCTSSQAHQALLETVEGLRERINAWYDAHPEATFDEIEEELGESGRAFLGDVIQLMLRRRDLGSSPEAPCCRRCGRPMVFKGYPKKVVHGLKADLKIRRAYYVCPPCEVGVFPLDRRLRLRRDRCSGGLVREVARLGTTQPSFEVAAETLSRLVGVSISDTTVWRCHREVSRQVEAHLRAEEEAVQCPVFLEQEPVPHEPIQEHASVSVDGTTVLIREEGYREVKMVSVSEVVLRPGKGKVGADEGPHGQVRGRQEDLKLSCHSYRVALGDKATFEPVLQTELARRRVSLAAKLTNVNDGADWPWDLASRYLPQRRVEVLDWPHALQNLSKAAEAAWGEGSAPAHAWLSERETELWAGRVLDVQVALEQLPRRGKARGKAIRQVKDYVARHAGRMDYQRFRQEGRPIGSGAVESAAKNVVGWRMKRGGQSWARAGATRMLAALGEVHSGRWDEACSRLAQAA